MPDTFWLGLFGLATLIVKEYFDQRKANRLAANQAELLADLKDNSALTERTNQTSNAAAVAVIQATESLDSAVKGQKSDLEVIANSAALKASDAATVIAKHAARRAEETAVSAAGAAKDVAAKVSIDIVELKETLNGVLAKKLVIAEEAGYARCLRDNVLSKLGEHDVRIGAVETKLDLVDSKITTVLEIVGKDRTTVRGESL